MSAPTQLLTPASDGSAEIKTEQKCLIWQEPAVVNRTDTDSFRVDSARAGGPYVASRSLWQVFEAKHFDNQQKALLTSWLVRNRAAGSAEPSLPTAGNIESFVKRLRPQSILQRADFLLRYLETQISHIGKLFEFESSSEYFRIYGPQSPKRSSEILAWSGSLLYDELTYLLEFLEAQGWINKSKNRNPALYNYSITVEGYSHLADLKTQISDSSQAFVAMWFDDSTKESWEAGIEPAIKEAGYDPLRIDQKPHINKIDDEIIAEIRRSRFLVADFTEGDRGARGGVYYEAGFAHGLKIPVIFTCHEDCLDKIHFDVQQYFCVVWKDPEELRSLLTKRISAVLGDGPNRRS